MKLNGFLCKGSQSVQSIEGTPSKSQRTLECFLCKEEIHKEAILFSKVLSVCKCLNCDILTHLRCMAKHFLETNQETFATQSTRQVQQLIPVDGDCPRCEARLMWGDLIKRGTRANLEIDEDDLEEDTEDEDFVERDDSDSD